MSKPTIYARETRYKSVSEIKPIAIDMRGQLDGDDTLAGTPTIADKADSGALPITNKVINAAVVNIEQPDGNDVAVPIGKAIQCMVGAGGIAGETHEIVGHCATTGGALLYFGVRVGIIADS